MAIDWTKICKKYKGLWIGLKHDEKTVVAAGKTVKEVMEKFKNTANVKAVFGEPYEKDGLTIIPVAKVFMSGGGGTMGWGKMWGKMKGAKTDETKEGDKTEEDTDKSMNKGWGGMVKTSPAGYIKVKDGQAEYVEIWDKNKIMMAGGMAIAGAFGLMMMKKMLWRKKYFHKHGAENLPQ